MCLYIYIELYRLYNLYRSILYILIYIIDVYSKCSKIFQLRSASGWISNGSQAWPSWAKLLQQLETFHGQGKIFLGEHTAQLLVEPLTDPPRDQESFRNKAKEGKCSTLLDIAQPCPTLLNAHATSMPRATSTNPPACRHVLWILLVRSCTVCLVLCLDFPLGADFCLV